MTNSSSSSAGSMKAKWGVSSSDVFFSTSGMSVATATGITHPLDVLKVRLQMQLVGQRGPLTGMLFICFSPNAVVSICRIDFTIFFAKISEHKIFIGMLPKNLSDAEVSALFSNYGTIKELQLVRGYQQTSKGCAFLKFETKEQALAAIEALNGKHKIEGSTVPLVVKWADTEKERQARRAQKALSFASNVPYPDDSRQHLYGALLMGYMPPYNGYGFQVCSVYN
ncbi:hypothetical protein SASPL_103455 [Salvia splendens]|uniref:RRM domain-containing protein n=1 Tax=Salvia splendens TaxID=180675 RepID=A0A8X8YHG7_SALSN|nr:hypothetical protein SASPL_103455 [Salvia splendens]